MSEQDFLVRDTRLPGHFWADNELYDVFGPQLGAYGFAVYMALCRNARNGTGECPIAMSQISRDLDISKSTVHQALARIVELHLARLQEAGGPRKAAIYVLADIKSLVNPDHAQLRLGGKPTSSVRIANAQKSSVREATSSVRIANENGNGANAAFVRRTPYKESNTVSRLNTKNTACSSCNNSGTFEHKGHPGRHVYCHCEAGRRLKATEQGKAMVTA